jgi:hypothetical protein
MEVDDSDAVGVATTLDSRILVADITRPLHPQVVAEIPTDWPVVSTAVHGTTLHAQKLDWRPSAFVKCLVGVECSPGDDVEVYDIALRDDPTYSGAYLAGAACLPELGVKGRYLVARSDDGFEVMEAVPKEQP